MQIKYLTKKLKHRRGVGFLFFVDEVNFAIRLTLLFYEINFKIYNFFNSFLSKILIELHFLLNINYIEAGVWIKSSVYNNRLYHIFNFNEFLFGEYDLILKEQVSEEIIRFEDQGRICDAKITTVLLRYKQPRSPFASDLYMHTIFPDASTELNKFQCRSKNLSQKTKDVIIFKIKEKIIFPLNQCKYNSANPFLKCAVNPMGNCAECYDYTAKD